MRNRRFRPERGNDKGNDRRNRKGGDRGDRGKRRGRSFGPRDGNNNRGSEGHGFADRSQVTQSENMDQDQGRGRGRGRERHPTDDFFNRLLRPGESNDFLEKTPCPACGKMPARIKGRLGPTLLRRCRACSLVYISPRLATSVREEMLRREPSPISSDRNLWLRHEMAERMVRMHREMPTVKGMNKRAASLLEIGCRWGHFLQLCRPHYRSVEGLEWSKERAAFARDRFDLQVSATDIFRDPWDGRYNVIAAWDLMEREPHPLEFLRWVHDHLEPGGQLVLSTPNYNSLSRRILGKRWFFFEPSRHLVYFTPATLKALLRQAGFTDVRIRTSGLSPLRDWFSDINRVDREDDPRDQWLESLRGREAVESARREGQTTIGRETAWKKARKRIATFLSSIVTSPGWGDEMRVYARRS
ncbi:MAG: Methyltransferase type 12 [Fibrobacteres bacterium]|nr:Methyltransferase type 12 [Fibrobacterota bacterium]